MTSGVQSAQRATCPPRAAVRQLSIAAITFNWPRLTWPALALRQAGPWSRKISAISRAARAMIAVAYDGGFFSDVSGVSRSNGLMTARITLVATWAGFLFEQVGGKAVAQCVRRHWLFDRRPIGS